MTRKQIIALGVFLAIASAGATRVCAQPYSISWFTIDGGGGYSSGSNFELDGTIGQHDAGAVMTGGGFELVGGFWAGGVVQAPLHTVPDSFLVALGSSASGGVAELAESDNQYLVLDPEFLSFRYQLEFTVDGTSPSSAPSGLEFSYESKAFNLVGTVEQKIDLFNFDSGQFESLDTRLTTPQDSIVSVAPAGDPTRFVEAGTDIVRARIRYQNSLPFWVFNTQNLYLPYKIRADHIFWTITP